MIEDMYAVMQRINEIRSRFGLSRRPQTQQVQGLEQNNPAQQVREIDATWPEGNAEVQQAINYLVGQGGQTPQAQNPLVSGLGNLMGGGNQGGQNFFQTLIETIRSDESSENE